MHEGDTIVPGAGVRWSHVHRTSPEKVHLRSDPLLAIVFFIMHSFVYTFCVQAAEKNADKACSDGSSSDESDSEDGEVDPESRIEEAEEDAATASAVRTEVSSGEGATGSSSSGEACTAVMEVKPDDEDELPWYDYIPLYYTILCVPYYTTVLYYVILMQYMAVGTLLIFHEVCYTHGIHIMCVSIS